MPAEKKQETDTYVIPHKSGAYQFIAPRAASLEDVLSALEATKEFVTKRKTQKK